MQQCRKCRINIEGSKERCPLCQGELIGTPEPEMYPRYVYKGLNSTFILKLVSFIAITASVICLATDYMLAERLTWSLISVGGIICAWLTTAVGITYRKNVIKNITWELILVTALAILWDKFTGSYGWSLDFVLPCASICSMVSTFILAKVLKMKSGEYMLYLIMGSIYGLIPFICLAAGLVTIKYPSVISIGVSIIFMAALIIFRGKSTKDEIERRFHL